jgi:hypothetical protein
MNCIVKHSIRRLGFCCPFAYFHASRHEKVAVVAAELNVGERTAKIWRKQYREGQLTCPGCSGCFRQSSIP